MLVTSTWDVSTTNSEVLMLPLILAMSIPSYLISNLHDRRTQHDNFKYHRNVEKNASEALASYPP